MIELARLGRHFHQTENECTSKICHTEKAWQAPQSLYQFMRPKPTSRSRAIRVLLTRALATEQERETALLIRRQKRRAAVSPHEYNFSLVIHFLTLCGHPLVKVYLDLVKVYLEWRLSWPTCFMNCCCIAA